MRKDIFNENILLCILIKISNSNCIADDTTFSFKIENENDGKKCEWITESPSVLKERVGYCVRENVAAGCVETCAGVRNDAIQVTAPSPTVTSPLALLDAPSSVPSDVTCQNDGDFSFKLTNIWMKVKCS